MFLTSINELSEVSQGSALRKKMLLSEAESEAFLLFLLHDGFARLR
ncbi:hypothetical protein [Paeniglutamicibacter terrestris]|uniref:Uncharacterized protein n=1 Tax=Paeniglutamicibacter terrestris TaxID=2723403 RepID=A0ABX1FZR1_9MICC|nr:hypothetical protein [Paeniglutamicibacter terrestris]NKG19424.1 hypothetical protein [Paeniglutamicibacter terrestris]